MDPVKEEGQEQLKELEDKIRRLLHEKREEVTMFRIPYRWLPRTILPNLKSIKK